MSYFLGQKNKHMNDDKSIKMGSPEDYDSLEANYVGTDPANKQRQKNVAFQAKMYESLTGEKY